VLKKDPSVIFAAIQGLKPYLCLWERARDWKGIVGSSDDSRNVSSLVPSCVPIFAGSRASHAVKTGCRIETFFSSSSSSSSSSGGSYPSLATPPTCQCGSCTWAPASSLFCQTDASPHFLLVCVVGWVAGWVCIWWHHPPLVL
jgi:hypothetical protein